MTPERWLVINDVFQRVSELPPSERDRALDEVSIDPEVQSEVRRLIAQLENVGSFMDVPPEAVRALHLPIEEQPRYLPGALINSRFEIIRLLGVGGMGEVYEACDLATGEYVALKTVRVSLAGSTQILPQFRRELRRARQITHPNVCRLHELFSVEAEIPQFFFTMELIRGQTLATRLRDGPQLAPEVALEYAAQIAAGLKAAHDARFIHRDLKPGNIMLAGEPPTTRVVITDFGLATNSADSTGGAEASAVTRKFAGTPVYMAPEQLRGERLSTAADMYSFGVVVCEMLLGERPSAKLRARTDRQERQWVVAVLKCTADDPADRYLSPAAFVDALKAPPGRSVGRRSILVASAAATAGVIAWWGSRHAKPTVRLAVLPLEDSTKSGEYVSYVATDMLVDRLRQFEGMEIPGPNTVRHLKGRSLPVRAMAQSLKVDWLLSWTLSVSGGESRLHARLIRADGSAGPWEKSFKGGLDSLNVITASIASEVASALRPALAQAGTSLYPAASDPEAYDLYLRARYYWNRRERDDLLQARQLLERCVQLDPLFAPGYCGLADTLSVLADYGQLPPAQILPLAKQAALRAISLNSELADAHVSFAFAVTLADCDWFTAERGYLRALQLNPHHGLAHQWYSGLLARLLRPAECLQHAEEAIRNDALSIPANRNLATMLYFLRQYPAAIRQAHRVQEMAPGFFGCRELLAESHARLHHREEALSYVNTMLAEARTPGFVLAHAACTYAILGMPSEAAAVLQRLTLPRARYQYQPIHIARALADLGASDECFHWLDIALAQQDTGLQILPMHESFDKVRKDPRFRGILERMRIVYPPM